MLVRLFAATRRSFVFCGVVVEKIQTDPPGKTSHTRNHIMQQNVVISRTDLSQPKYEVARQVPLGEPQAYDQENNIPRLP